MPRYRVFLDTLVKDTYADTKNRIMKLSSQKLHSINTHNSGSINSIDHAIGFAIATEIGEVKVALLVLSKSGD
jgi:hypothetical protein